MPRNKNKNNMLKGQARQMVYDVHCFLKRETEDIVRDIKQVKDKFKESIDKQLKNLTVSIDMLHQLLKKSEENTNILCMMTSILDNLKLIREETVECNKLANSKLERIINNLKQNQKRTAEATNSSIATVRRISTQVDGSELMAEFKIPGKKRNRKKPITDMDNFNLGVAKRCIHNYHLINKELPTVAKLKRKLEEEINFQGSYSSLRRIIKHLGFRWKKVENSGKVLVESSNIRLQRIDYLQKIRQYRQEGRHIVYIDESFIDISSYAKVHVWTDNTTKGNLKGKHIVIVHAGSETGFVPNALAIFNADSKSSDYKDYMNYKKYENWLQTQLMPNLPPNSVVVVDNVSYHNKHWDPAPTLNSRIEDMQTWLAENGIQYDKTSPKSKLYKLIQANKERLRIFSIDKILAEQNHDVLRLPPFHPDLNPVECAWSVIKQCFSSKNENWNLNKIIDLVRNKLDQIESEEWQIICRKIKDVEEEYARSDHIIDLMLEEFIIQVGEDSSDDDDDIVDDGDYIDEMLTSSEDDEMDTTNTLDIKVACPY